MMGRQLSPFPLNRWVGMGALAGLLVGLVLQAPARWLSEGVAQASHQRVLLLNPQGTLWRGSANLALSDGQRAWDTVPLTSPSHGTPSFHGTPSASALPTRLPSQLHWQINPYLDFQTLALGLKLQISTACCTALPLQTFVTPTWQGLQISSHDQASRWPAAWLTGLGAPWNTLQPEGELQLRSHQLQWLQPWSMASAQPRLSGQLELQWQQFSTRLSTLRPLGNYRVVVKGGDTMQMQLDTLEGSLQLQGRGEWHQGRLRFRGEAKAQTDAETALSNLLNVLGQRRGNVSFMEIG